MQIDINLKSFEKFYQKEKEFIENHNVNKKLSCNFMDRNPVINLEQFVPSANKTQPNSTDEKPLLEESDNLIIVRGKIFEDDLIANGDFLSKGCMEQDVKNFSNVKLPAFFSHDGHSKPAIGFHDEVYKNKELSDEKKNVYFGKMSIYTDTNFYQEYIKNSLKNGVLSGFSVGLIIDNWSYETKGKSSIFTIKEAYRHELSLVYRPAIKNSQIMSLGIKDNEELLEMYQSFLKKEDEDIEQKRIKASLKYLQSIQQI